MRVQYFGIGFSDSEVHAVQDYLERKAKPDSEQDNSSLVHLPLTFRYDGAVVEISNMPYTRFSAENGIIRPQFYREFCIEISADNPQAVFNELARDNNAVAINMRRQEGCGYPFGRAYKLSNVADAVKSPEPELELAAK